MHKDRDVAETEITPLDGFAVRRGFASKVPQRLAAPTEPLETLVNTVKPVKG